MIRNTDILDALRAGEVRLPPLEFDLVGIEPKLEAKRGGRSVAYVDIRWSTQTYRCIAEVRVQATPKTLRDAMEQVQRYATAREMRPLVITTYLAPERLEELESRGICGVDLSGNGVVVVPGKVLVFRTGNPNRFPADRKIRNVYQGASSLVARVFLVRPRYESVQEVMDEVTARGGRVSLSTVAKVLKVLEEDLVIQRDGRATGLLQADLLLERFAENYKPPRIEAHKKYRWAGDREELRRRLRDLSPRLVLTGAASVEWYGIMPREKAVQCYGTALGPIERQLGAELEESARFPDLELVETRDPTVYFDSRTMDTIASSSPLQCWLELEAGDKRQQDASRALRDRIMDELRRQGWASP